MRTKKIKVAEVKGIIFKHFLNGVFGIFSNLDDFSRATRIFSSKNGQRISLLECYN
jgi:hypothetical protein